MPLYLCPCPNSDVSVVQARNKTKAIIRLDGSDEEDDGDEDSDDLS